MAISAKFEADYTQFVASTKGATDAMAGMKTGSLTLGSSLNAMMTGVPTGLSKITQGVTTSTGALSKMGGAATSMMGALGVAFSVGAVVNYGRALLATADDLVRTADRTGMLVVEVQKLSFIAGQSGNDLGEMTGAIGQMQNRLASGDDSAIAAVTRLGLTMKQLENAGPYDQVRLLSGAFGKVEGPAKAAELAMDLFGKSGIAVLPTLTSEFDNLAAAAPVMSDATVRALESAGDQIEKFQLQIKVYAAESYNLLGKAFDWIVIKAYEFAASMQEMTAGVLRMIEKLPGGATIMEKMGMSTKVASDAALWYRDAAAAMTRATNDTTAAVGKAPVNFEKFSRSVKDATAEAKAHETALRKAADAQREFEKATTIALRAYGKAAEDFDLWQGQVTQGLIGQKLAALETHDVFIKQLAPGLLTAGGNMRVVEADVDALSTKITGRLSDALGRIPKMFIDAFTGGGGVIGALKAIGVDLLNAIVSEILNPIMGAVSSWVGGIARAIAGAFSGNGFAMPAFGGLLGGATAGVGGTAGVTAGLIGGGGAGAGAGLTTALVGALPIVGALAAAIPLIISGWNLPGLENTMGGGGLTMGEAIRAHGQLSSGQQMQQYANSNRDLYERQVAAGEMPPGYTFGTHGQFVNFGAGRNIRVHGEEKITPKGEEEGASRAVVDALTTLRRDLIFLQPKLIAKALAIANAKTGARS